MPKPEKRGSGSPRPTASRQSAPSYIFICRGTITVKGKAPVDYEAKFFDIKLPCNLADLASEAAQAAFSLCEALAFKAGIQFLPAKEIKIGEDRQETEDSPF